ncbi:hypothetical protein Hanom_Chr06g00507971 [Helianthus anomalus]
MANRTLLSSCNNTLSLIFLLIIITISSSSSMAETDSSIPASVSATTEEAAIHIVYTDRPQHKELEDDHIRTLSLLIIEFLCNFFKIVSFVCVKVIVSNFFE